MSLAYTLLALLITNHALSTALRTVHALMASSVSEEMSLGASEIGLFAGAYNVAFALMQLPVGVALDRYGTRLTCAVSVFIVAIGAAVSALAPHLEILVLGQIIIGIGCAPALMGGFMFASQWFSAERFGAISSVMISLGSIGMILTATPLAYLMDAVGWRGAFWVFAALAVCLFIMILIFIQDTPPGAEVTHKPNESILQNLWYTGKMLVDYRLLGLLVVGLMAYPIKLTLRSVWVGPYFTDIHQLDIITVGNIALALSLAVVVGPSLAPLFQKMIGRRAVISGAVIVGGATLCAMSLWGGVNVWLDTILLFICILIIGCYVLSYSSARDRFEPQYTGRALSTLNFAVFAGSALWQVLTGALLDFLAPIGDKPDLYSYHVMYMIMGILSVLSGIVYLITRPKNKGHVV